jgi:uncharacterized protein (DUF1501 family)
MLEISSPGLSRRGFLKIGALGSLSLPALLQSRALQAATGQPAADTAAILVWCAGGPTQFETYDPKPDAPAEYRGPYKAIDTTVAGIQVCEFLPRHAKVADRFTLVRSCAHRDGGHGSATRYVLSGYVHPSGNEGAFLYPTIGSVVAKVHERAKRAVPSYVQFPAAGFRGDSGVAYLGAAYAPFGVNPKEAAQSLALPAELTAQRLENRQAMLKAFDQLRRDADASGIMTGMDTFTQQAFGLVTSQAARQAMDLSRESAETQKKYGNHEWGQGCLLARRLVEAGVNFVTVTTNGWDMHSNIPTSMTPMAPHFDAAVAGLIEDLYQRGLDKKVIVIVLGEFGRTPIFGKDLGRDHWPNSMSVLLAGGGLKVGQIIGSTDARGERPKDRPLHPNDVWASVYQFLGIDLQRTFVNGAGRPIPVLPHGEPISELL